MWVCSYFIHWCKRHVPRLMASQVGQISCLDNLVFMPLYYLFPSLPPVYNRRLTPMRICHYHGSVMLRSLPLLLDAQTMLCCCAVDCLKTAAAAVTVTVNTSVGVEDSGPSTAPLDSTSKIGLETILWLCYMIIYCPCCCVGREVV